MSYRDQAPSSLDSQPPPDLYSQRYPSSGSSANRRAAGSSSSAALGGAAAAAAGGGGSALAGYPSSSSSAMMMMMDAEYDYKASSPQSPGTLKPGVASTTTTGMMAGGIPPLGAATSSAFDGEDALLDLAQLEELHREAEKMKALGNKHMAAQEYTRAYNAYSAALQLSPVGPSSHVFLSNRAAALLSLKRYQAAATDARRAVALAPTFGKAHARLGQALYFMKDYEGAVDAYRDAIEYEPDNQVTQTYLEKATAKLERRRQQMQMQHRTDEAMTVNTHNTGSPSIFSNESTTPMSIANSVVTTDRQRTGIVQSLYNNQQRSAHALAGAVAPEVAAATSPSSSTKAPTPTAPAASAAAPRSIAAGAGAQPPVVAAVAAPPPSAAAALSPSSKQHPGTTSTATTATTEIADHDPDVEEALRIQHRANQYLANKEYTRSIEEYTAALFLVPDDPILSPNLHLGRAHALNGCRRHERAKNDAIMAIRLQPSPAAFSTLAKSLFYLKDYAGAIAAFQDCVEMLPEGEQLGMFDRAYLAKAEAALEDEEASLQQAGRIHGGGVDAAAAGPFPASHANNLSSSRSVLSTASTVPKLPPPRFVPREQALSQPPVVPAMPRQWPQQSADSPKVFRCGDEVPVVFLSESLGVKLNRGSDGWVRVLWVAKEEPGSPIARQGSIQVGHVVREAAGVDLRRPITNVMWGDTVALIKMAVRPITLVVAPELSDVPAPVLEEIRRANEGVLPPSVRGGGTGTVGPASPSSPKARG